MTRKVLFPLEHDYLINHFLILYNYLFGEGDSEKLRNDLVTLKEIKYFYQGNL